MKKLVLLFTIIFSGFASWAQTVDYTFVTVGCNRVDIADVIKPDSSTANVYALNRLFTEVNQLSPKPKYLFVTGDIVFGYTNDTIELARQLKGWVALYKAHPISKSGITVVAVPGNHETQDKAAGKKSFIAAERTFLREMKDFVIGNNGPKATGLVAGTDSLITDQSRLTYSFNYKNDHFVVLNTDPVGRDSRLPYHWIKSDLATAKAANARHIFAFGHKPAYSSAFKPLDGLEAFVPQRDSFWVAMEQYNAEAMFSAHEHIWDTIHPHKGKTWQVIAGNGGSAVEATWNKAPYNYHGFTLVTVYTDNSIKCQSFGHDIGTKYTDAVDGNLTSKRAEFDLTTGAVITHTPLKDTRSSGAFTVNATITDNILVSSVVLNYTVNGVAQTAIVPTVVGNAYTFTIPAQLNSGFIEYSIKATDNFGQISYLPTVKGSTFKFAFGPVAVSKFTLNSSPKIGTYNGMDIFLSGASGLSYVQGSANEYYTITDRGPNLDVNLNKNVVKLFGANAANAKLFALPAFNPQIIRLKAEGDSLHVVSATTLKRPDGTATSGIINPVGGGGTGELALTDTNGTTATSDVWGIDSEGIIEGVNNDFWLCEEYGTSVWHVNKADGKVINRYAPFATKQAQDLPLDTAFKFRNPNKGLEGVAYAPNGKVYAFIQNTLLFPAAVDKKTTRLHRFVEIDPATNTTKMLGYQHDLLTAKTTPLSTIGNDKRYIGDAAAINNNEFLILEHGKSSTESYAKIYKIDIQTGSAITQDFYGAGKLSFEQMLDSTTAAANGITVVKKTLFLDLIANGYDVTIEKQEGLAIVNDSTIAIINDNDFGVVANNADGIVSPNGVKTYLYTFSVPSKLKLNLCVPTKVSVSQSGTTLSASLTGTSYQWYLNGSIIPTATNKDYVITTAGKYKVKVIQSASCDMMSDEASYTVTGVDGVASSNGLSVYPNPGSTGEVVFSKTISFTLYSASGIPVKSYVNVNSMSTAGIKTGVYFIKTTDGEVVKYVQE